MVIAWWVAPQKHPISPAMPAKKNMSDNIVLYFFGVSQSLASLCNLAPDSGLCIVVFCAKFVVDPRHLTNLHLLILLEDFLILLSYFLSRHYTLKLVKLVEWQGIEPYSDVIVGSNSTNPPTNPRFLRAVTPI